MTPRPGKAGEKETHPMPFANTLIRCQGGSFCTRLATTTMTIKNPHETRDYYYCGIHAAGNRRRTWTAKGEITADRPINEADVEARRAADAKAHAAERAAREARTLAEREAAYTPEPGYWLRRREDEPRHKMWGREADVKREAFGDVRYSVCERGTEVGLVMVEIAAPRTHEGGWVEPATLKIAGQMRGRRNLMGYLARAIEAACAEAGQMDYDLGLPGGARHNLSIDRLREEYGR